MKTACQTCGAVLVRRVWVRDVPALFVEVYACDAAQAFGLVEKGIAPLYRCGVELPKETT